MEMNNILKLGLALLLSLTLLTGCGEKKVEEEKKEEVKVNTNENVIKDQEVGVFKFENTSLIYENGTSKLETSVTNTSGETQKLAQFKIHVKDAEGNEIVEMTGFFGGTIAAGETKIVTSVYGEDLSNAASIEYEM